MADQRGGELGRMLADGEEPGDGAALSSSRGAEGWGEAAWRLRRAWRCPRAAAPALCLCGLAGGLALAAGWAKEPLRSAARRRASHPAADAAVGLSEHRQALAPADFADDVYVELKSDPMAGGFLKKGANGKWSVWPRMGGKSFKGFIGYGYHRVHAKGGKVADDIDPQDWEVVPFPVARTGPSASGGDSFYTDGDRQHRGDYTDLVGKTFRFTISGLGGLDCGCNANFYAVRLGAGCDGSGNRPEDCEEIDFFEGNKWAWHSTLHTLADNGRPDHDGLCTGYGGTLPTKPNFPSFDGDEYGPQGTMIDTEGDFHVAVSFPTTRGGKLKGMCVELSQEGKPSMEQPLFMHLYAYNGSLHTEPGEGGGIRVQNGMDKVEKRMADGVTMLSSLWSGGMSWLDGAASQHGPNNIMDGACTGEGECAGYTIQGIAIEDIEDNGGTGTDGSADVPLQ